jgi:hypothetical protein
VDALPRTLADVTSDWVSSTLRAGGHLGDATVTGVDVRELTQATAVFGVLARVAVAYDGPAPGAPTSLVLKLPTQAPENFEVGKALRLYEREVAFYRELGGGLPVRVPRCYHAGVDEEGRTALLLEDLADLRCGDQVVGLTLRQAELAVDALARLHAAWWARPELDELTWLPQIDDPTYLAAVPGIFRTGLPLVEERYRDRVPAEALAFAGRLAPAFEEMIVRCAQPPHTIAHSDTRLDNLFFAPDPADDAFALIDFQLVLRGRGVGDIAYLLGSSMDVDLQRRSASDLLRRYHGALLSAGVDGYPFERCLQDFRESVAFYLSGPLSLVGTFDTHDERGAAMTDLFVTRFFALAAECGCAELL